LKKVVRQVGHPPEILQDARATQRQKLGDG
jgi:hypothetical protein